MVVHTLWSVYRLNIVGKNGSVDLDHQRVAKNRYGTGSPPRHQHKETPPHSNGAKAHTRQSYTRRKGGSARPHGCVCVRPTQRTGQRMAQRMSPAHVPSAYVPSACALSISRLAQRLAATCRVRGALAAFTYKLAAEPEARAASWVASSRSSPSSFSICRWRST